MNYIIFGGSGFIGTHLIKMLKQEVITNQDKIYNLDIVMPGEEGIVPGIVEKIEGVEYLRLDIRKPIEFSFTPTANDIIFNLAAVHRTPGHPDHEYFETNILGAENVTDFAEKHGINKILFTSSIAPYGAAESIKTEDSLPTPNSPYGISKLVAEKIHAIWQAKDPKREVTIVRPGVVYGKGEHGNFTRLYWGQRKRYFFYPGRRNTIKACIYVKELIHFMKYRMIDNSFKSVDVFNCTFEPSYTIEQICTEMQKATNMKRYIPLVSSWILIMAATVFGPIGGKKVGLHPERVRKLMISTNICGKKLGTCGYKFHYTFEETLKDWYTDCNKKGLF
ncbi:NAD-dependent epimerase/dehydratase family protein [Amedibacillus sp. YH-ame6]